MRVRRHCEALVRKGGDLGGRKQPQDKGQKKTKREQYMIERGPYTFGRKRETQGIWKYGGKVVWDKETRMVNLLQNKARKLYSEEFCSKPFGTHQLGSRVLSGRTTKHSIGTRLRGRHKCKTFFIGKGNHTIEESVDIRRERP